MSVHDNKNTGFTLVEMIVVIPMVVLIIGLLIGLMTTLVNNVVVSNGRTQLIYDAQNALNMIEQDTFLSNSFLTSYIPPAPQDINNGGATPFTSVNGTSTSIIFNEYATNNNPMNSARQIIHYALPTSCSVSYKTNEPFFTKTIYFIKNSVLYRRVVVPVNNQSATPDANTTCGVPWQRGSCASGVTGTLCKTLDSVLTTGVSSMNLFYFNKANPAVSVAIDQADSIKITLNLSKTLGGKPVTTSITLSASQAVAQGD